MIVQNVLDLPRLLVSNLIQYKYSSIDSFQHFREGMTVDWRKKLEEVGSTQEEVLCAVLKSRGFADWPFDSTQNSWLCPCASRSLSKWNTKYQLTPRCRLVFPPRPAITRKLTIVNGIPLVSRISKTPFSPPAPKVANWFVVQLPLRAIVQQKCTHRSSREKYGQRGGTSTQVQRHDVSEYFRVRHL